MIEQLKNYKQTHLLAHHSYLRTDTHEEVKLIEDLTYLDYATVDFVAQTHAALPPLHQRQRPRQGSARDEPVARAAEEHLAVRRQEQHRGQRAAPHQRPGLQTHRGEERYSPLSSRPLSLRQRVRLLRRPPADCLHLASASSITQDEPSDDTRESQVLVQGR